MSHRRASLGIGIALTLIGGTIAFAVCAAGPLPGDLGLAQAIQAIGAFDLRGIWRSWPVLNREAARR